MRGKIFALFALLAVLTPSAYVAAQAPPVCVPGIGGITCTEPIPPAPPDPEPTPPPEEPPGEPTPQPINDPQPTPPPRPRCGEVYRSFSHRANNVCYYRVWTIDCDTGVIVVLGNEPGPCGSPPEPPTEDPCTDGWVISGGRITCRRGEGVLLEASVSYPPFLIDIYPFPTTIVGWPSMLRLANVGVSVGRDTYEYVPRGGGSPDAPAPGDRRNVVFELSLQPVEPSYVEVHLPNVGRRVLVQGDVLPVTFNLPSHPDAGGASAPEQAVQVGLASDFPAFRGSARAAYTLHWRLSWEEFERHQRRVRDENGNYICDPQPTSNPECYVGGNTGRWRRETIEEWKPYSIGGVIDPDLIEGLPESRKADIDGDGDAEAFWSYRVQQRTMDAKFNPVGAVYELGGFYWWVREGQGAIGWPGN